eukprot:SAG22_NODE_1256_length_4995_cov_4.293096_5_plen_133_part_01
MAWTAHRHGEVRGEEYATEELAEAAWRKTSLYPSVLFVRTAGTGVLEELKSCDGVGTWLTGVSSAGPARIREAVRSGACFVRGTAGTVTLEDNERTALMGNSAELIRTTAPGPGPEPEPEPGPSPEPEPSPEP